MRLLKARGGCRVAQAEGVGLRKLRDEGGLAAWRGQTMKDGDGCSTTECTETHGKGEEWGFANNRPE